MALFALSSLQEEGTWARCDVHLWNTACNFF